jgi:hypothetical protein
MIKLIFDGVKYACRKLYFVLHKRYCLQYLGTTVCMYVQCTYCKCVIGNICDARLIVKTQIHILVSKRENIVLFIAYRS